MIVYFVQINLDGPVKIGKTCDDVRNRLVTLRTGVPYPSTLLGVIETKDSELEATMHNRFRHLRICREWFRPDEELMQFIRSSTVPPTNSSARHRRKQPGRNWSIRKEKVAIDLSDDEATWLRRKAKRCGVKPDEIVSRAIQAYLESERKGGK